VGEAAIVEPAVTATDACAGDRRRVRVERRETPVPDTGGARPFPLGVSQHRHRSSRRLETIARGPRDHAGYRDQPLRTELFKSLGRPVQPIELDRIGHGSGGLVARAYVANHTGRSGENRVRRCITIGTPHLGTAWLQVLPLNHPLFVHGRSLLEMRVDYMTLLFPGSLRGGYGSTRFYPIGSSVNANPYEPEAIPGRPFSKADDFYVSTFRATHPSWGGTVAASAGVPYRHDQVIQQEDVRKQIKAWLDR